MAELDRDVAGVAPAPAAPPLLDPVQLVENDNNVGEQDRHIPQDVFPAQNNQNVQHHNPRYIDFAAVYHISQRRRFLEQDLRVEDVAPGGFFDPHPENEYRPLSPQNSDEDAEVFRLVNARRQAQRVIGNMRQYLDEDNARQQALRDLQHGRVQEVNNNGNFRDHNGYLSPSPSPTPSPHLMDDDDESDDDEDGHSKAEDMEVEMLMAQMVQLQPHQSRPRKRHNSESNEEVAKKKVTFKPESSDETLTSIDENLPVVNHHNLNFRRFDDDDEGFFGGPPTRRDCISG